MDRPQLADFLRRRREALQPEDVGIARGPRRRTSGLRREEVALLASMSTDYYGRLEQQRGPQPSESMLAAIARALRLTQEERDHLFRLAGHTPPPRTCRSDHVSPALMRVLDRLDTPAQVVTDLGETLVQNEMAVALLGDQTRYAGLERALIYRWFTDTDGARGRYVEADHDRLTRSFVAGLRVALARHPSDRRALALVDGLHAVSPEFTALWDEHDVGAQIGEAKRIAHPQVGPIEVQCQHLVAESEAQVLLVYTVTPGTEDAEKLRLLSVIGDQEFAPTPSR